MLKRARPLLGTIVEIRVDGAAEGPIPARLAEPAVASAFESIAYVDKLMSFHRHDSDLARLHAAEPGQRVSVHPWTMHVLRQAFRMFERTSGIFDPSVAAALVADGLLPAPVGPRPATSTTFDSIVLHSDCTVVRKEAVWLDLGGIAKGFAVDVAVGALRDAGVRAGAVSAGGDLRVFGDTDQPIFVRSPQRPAEMHLLGALNRGAVATSGAYFLDSFGHSAGKDAIVGGALLRGHFPKAPRYSSVSLIAPRCIWADALTKVVTLAGIESPITIKALSLYHAQAVVS